MIDKTNNNPFFEAQFRGGLLALMALVGNGVVISSDNESYVRSSPSFQFQGSVEGSVSRLFDDAFANQEHSSSEDAIELAGQAHSATNVGLVVSDLLPQLLTEFNLSKKFLSELLGVARPTLYSWLKGGVVSDENYERLIAIAELVTSLDEAHKADLPRLLKMFVPGSNGKKFAELFGEAVQSGNRSDFLTSYDEVKERLEKRISINRRLPGTAEPESAANQISSLV